MSNDIVVKPLNKPLSGEIEIPPDKSISHRGIIIGSLTFGKLTISNFSKGKDPVSTLNIFKNLGVDIKYIDEKKVVIDSTNGLSAPQHPLDCGNSGTTMRIMSGVLASRNFGSTLIGDLSLSKRPMKRIIEPLSLMGAKIESSNGKAPLKIEGQNLKGVEYTSKIASAQVKSSILLAGLNAEGETTVFEPVLSRNHTENMLKYFNADIKTGKTEKGFFASVKKGKLEPKNISVPGDISSAAFFMAAGATIKGSDIIIKNVCLNETRTGIIEIMQKMGADIRILDIREKNNEKAGDIRVKYSPELKGIEIGGDIIPRLIDEIPVICVLASYAKGQTVIKDAGDLKNKESDRINCTSCELLKMGADITPTNDGFIINGKELKGGADLNCYHDHRLAMSLYIASLGAKKESLIRDFHWVNTSFPEFLELLERL